MKTLKALGNLYVAIALLAVLGLVLILSTSLESAFGTPFVQRFFYQAGWFDVLLGLFFVNIFCATLTRWPFKKHHTGFVVTHIGILMVLAGSLLTRLFGVDGQLALSEKETGSTLVHSVNQLVVHKHDAEHGWSKALNPGGAEGKRGIKVPGTDLTFTVDEVIEDGVETTVIKEGGPDAPPNRAVSLLLSSERAGLEDKLTLSQKNPFEEAPSKLAMGPAVIELKTQRPAGPAPAVESPSAHITVAGGGELLLDLGKLPAGDIPIPGSGITLRGLKYYPDARVDGSKLVSVSDAPNNPAVEFEAADVSGKTERHTRFALFPDFESIHGRGRVDSLGLSVEILLPKNLAPAPRGASMVLYAEPGRMSFESKNTAGNVTAGDIEKDRTYAAGWMDFKFKVVDTYERAVFEKKVERVTGGQKGELAAKVSVRRGDDVVASDWVTARRPFMFGSGSAPIIAVLERKRSEVPFKLTLDDFRKVDYPGTSNAASYESDVTLEDPAEGLTIKKTISMNKPLDHKGYRIFQSSFAQDPMSGELSVFTVAKNPGIGLIYSGSLILFAGVVLIFYVSPLSSFQSAKGKRK